MLAQRDDAAGGDILAIGQCVQILRGEQAARRQPGPQQRQWVAAQRQAGGAVVEQDVFAFGRVGQLQRRFMRGHVFHQLRRVVDSSGLPHLLAAVARQRGQRVGGSQRVDVQRAQLRAQGQVLRIAEISLLAGFKNAVHRAFRQARHQAQPQTNGGLPRANAGKLARVLRGGGHLQRTVPSAAGHVHCPHLDAVALGVLHQLRRGVKPHRLRVDERRHEARGFVAFEPAAHIHQLGKTGGMAFRKAVFTKAANLAENAL